MSFGSIRFKISFWYFALLTLTLLILGTWVYHDLSRRLGVSLENLLQVRADGIADSIDTYWETEKLGMAERGFPSEASSRAHNLDFARIAQNWVRERTDDPALLNIVVRIRDADGNSVASTKGAAPLTAATRVAIPSALKGQSRFDDIAADPASGRPEAFRMLTLPVIENEKVVYIIQVLSPSAKDSGMLRNLKLVLFLLLPFTIVISVVIGSLIARLALNPIDRMVDTAQKISADKLQLRIAAPQSRDEIRKLADTFNAMLGRVEEGFLSQRRFLDDLAHELKTPLSIMKGELEVTLMKTRPASEYSSALNSNLDEVNRLIRIVNDLLVLARLDRSVVSLDMKRLDLGDLAGNVVHALKSLADVKGIDLRLNAGRAAISGDEVTLKRLLINILDNAIKYTPSGGAVTVETSVSSGEAAVSITDTGRGIADDDIPFIFDRFRRARYSGDSEGTGLGLNIAQSIAEAHGGRIEVRSAPGHGSTFKVLFPLDGRD